LENRLAVGEASALDVTRERISRNQISLAIRDAERQGAEARAQLATAIGVPVRALDAVEISFDAFDMPVPLRSDAATGEFRREALLNRTDVQSLLAEYASAQSGLQLQIASRFPNFNLGPGYAYDQGDNTYSLNVSAELPVFNRNQGPIAEAEARRKDVNARFTALQAQIIGAIDQAATGYRSATATLSTADVLIEDQQRRQSQIESSFRAGQTDRPTLVATELELAAVRLSRFEALVLQLQAVGALEDALQQPLFDPRSGPRVPEQNPRLTHKEEPLP
jgi:outer membrane protein TolC